MVFSNCAQLSPEKEKEKGSTPTGMVQNTNMAAVFSIVLGHQYGGRDVI